MSFENRYSSLDRLLHRISFASGQLQTAIADIEDRLYADSLDSIAIEAPVFITALPRAGTTILLNLLVETGAFASHTYRDMPFVLCPMLWNRFSDRFDRDADEQERAHGDGLSISVESPEALEEIIWKTFWSKHYKKDHIEPWRSFNEPEFVAYLRNHMRKIIAIRRQAGNGQPGRYLSKNNLNMARLQCLDEVFPDSVILVPFREPLQHAASLLNMHRRFTEMHAEDSFSRQYMQGVGHFDFGANLRPIDFATWFSGQEGLDPDSLAFWLQYWTFSYEHVLSLNSANIHCVSYADLTEQPERTLGEISSALKLSDPQVLIKRAASLKIPARHAIDESALPEQLLWDARRVYAALNERQSTQRN